MVTVVRVFVSIQSELCYNDERRVCHKGESLQMSQFSFEVVEHLAVLSESPKGWKKELNLVSWNDHPPKFDIREWSPDHEKMGKGVTFSNEEMAALKKVLSEMVL